MERSSCVLEALWPVAVMVDEADTFLGNRGSGGDSGTSSRVFGSIASCEQATVEDLKAVFEDFVPPNYPLEIELPNLVAVQTGGMRRWCAAARP